MHSLKTSQVLILRTCTQTLSMVPLSTVYGLSRGNTPIIAGHLHACGSGQNVGNYICTKVNVVKVQYLVTSSAVVFWSQISISSGVGKGRLLFSM